MNSGRRARSRFAALDKTVNRVDASAWLQTPLEKFSRDETTMALTVSWGVESIVAIGDSVAGLMTWMPHGENYLPTSGSEALTEAARSEDREIRRRRVAG
jgi:hypothetical protein